MGFVVGQCYDKTWGHIATQYLVRMCIVRSKNSIESEIDLQCIVEFSEI